MTSFVMNNSASHATQTGTGEYTLSDAMDGHQSIQDGAASVADDNPHGKTFDVHVRPADGTDTSVWAVMRCTYEISGSDHKLVRSATVDSSNNGEDVNFATGLDAIVVLGVIDGVQVNGLKDSLMPINVTVGADANADFSLINDALTDIEQNSPYGSRVVMTLQDGTHNISNPVIVNRASLHLSISGSSANDCIISNQSGNYFAMHSNNHSYVGVRGIGLINGGLTANNNGSIVIEDYSKPISVSNTPYHSIYASSKGLIKLRGVTCSNSANYSIFANSGSFIDCGNAVVSGGVRGVFANEKSLIISTNSNASGHSESGFFAQNGSSINCTGSAVSGGTFARRAYYSSNILSNGFTQTGANTDSSPALGTVGNSNSIVQG